MTHNRRSKPPRACDLRRLSWNRPLNRARFSSCASCLLKLVAGNVVSGGAFFAEPPDLAKGRPEFIPIVGMGNDSISSHHNSFHDKRRGVEVEGQADAEARCAEIDRSRKHESTKSRRNREPEIYLVLAVTAQRQTPLFGNGPVDRNDPHRFHVQSDPLNSSLRSWASRRGGMAGCRSQQCGSLVAGFQDRVIRRLGIHSGMETATIERHSGPVVRACFSPDGMRPARCGQVAADRRDTFLWAAMPERQAPAGLPWHKAHCEKSFGMRARL